MAFLPPNCSLWDYTIVASPGGLAREAHNLSQWTAQKMLGQVQGPLNLKFHCQLYGAEDSSAPAVTAYQLLPVTVRLSANTLGEASTPMSLSAKTGQGLEPHRGQKMDCQSSFIDHLQDRDAVSVDATAVQSTTCSACCCHIVLEASTSGQDTTTVLPSLHIKAWSLSCSQ